MATISIVKICNMALSHIGNTSPIESIDEDSAEAKQCKTWYDYSRIMTLEAFNWSFARKRITLSAHSEDPPDDWVYRYNYPDASDSLVVRALANPAGPNDDAVPYEIEMSGSGEQKTILTDLEDAVAICTFDQEATPLFSSHFVMTLSYAVAANIAFALTGKKDIKADMLNVWQGMIAQAKAVDANETSERPPRDASWIRVR